MKKITLLFAVAFFGVMANAQVLLTENFDSALDWPVTRITGTSTAAGWSQVTSGTDPNCAPFSGAGMAEFNSYDIEAGNAFMMTSPEVTFGGLFYKVTFSMYRDGGAVTNTDKVKILYSASGAYAGATSLATINRSSGLSPIEEANGWYTYDAYLPYGTSGTGHILIYALSNYGNNIYLDNVSLEQVNTINAAQIMTVSVNKVLSVGNYPITGTFKNVGANTITSLDLNWQVNGGATQTQSLSGLNIPPGQTYVFTHSTQWAATPGTYNMSVWASNTNGDAGNDNIKTLSGYVVNEIFPKTVVYEEATGTWCGWCVRGHIGLKDMDHYHPDITWIGIAVHNQDPMVLTEYDASINQFISGYPGGTINRNPADIDPGLSSLEGAYSSELAKKPLAKVDVVNQTWDPATRAITFDAQAIFALDLNNANYNLSAVIVENNVAGTSSSWRQRNYYSGSSIVDWTGLDWGTYPSYVPATTMIYNHVGRTLLGGYSGVDGSVPTSVTYNTPNTYTFTHTLPTSENADNIEIVVMLLDNATGKIVNAKEIELDTALATKAFNASHYGISPNPTNGIFNIATEKPVSVSIADVLGKVIYQAENVTRETAINLSGFQKGVYFAKISGDAKTATEKIILN